MSDIEIKKRVHRLLRDYSNGRFPVPVIEIATKLGIGVFADKSYPDDKNGHIQIDNDSKMLIVVNSKHPAVRKRFTIAHEIAHFEYDIDYLKQYGSIDRKGDASDSSYRAREKRANSFAAELIMPEEQFIEQWIALNCIDEVADYFFVSSDAVKYRALNIGLI